MKNILTGFLFVAILAAAAAANAEETKVTVGLKAWQNSWEEKTETAAGGTETLDLGSSLMVGPSVNVRFANNWFAGATFLATAQDYETKDLLFTGDLLTVSRKDLDVIAGYMFTPRFGAFFGYKSIDADATYTLPASLGSGSGSFTWELTGPGLGILGNIPLTDSIALYGSLAVLSIDSTFTNADGTSTTADLVGASVELGAAFAFAERMSANIGIKSQSFSGDEDDGGTTTDTFTGLTFGVNYTF
jgi:hypothetical protein